MAKLTAEERDKLPDSDFALPGRKYPIHDEAHARDALARVAQDGTADEQAKVREAVKRKFPDIVVDGGSVPKKMMIALSFRNEDMYRASDAAGLPTEIMGQPVEYWWKDIIHPGIYDKKGWPMPLSATPTLIEHFEKSGNGMDAAGVPIPINCDHSESARDSMGFIKRFKIENGRLMGLCQLIGTDAVTIASRNWVSPLIDPDFTDGEGRNWGEAITHVALTPRPVVPDQNKFVKAASLFSARADVLTLSLAENSDRSQQMADEMMPCSAATMGKLNRHVGGLSDKPMDSKAEHVANHLDAVHGGLKKLSAMSDDYSPTQALSIVEAKLNSTPRQMSAVTAQKARRSLSLAPDLSDDQLPEVITDKAISLTSELSTKTAALAAVNEQVKAKDEQIIALSAAAPKTPDKTMMGQYVDNWKLRREHAIGTGKFTEPEMKSLEAIFSARDGNFAPMALSTCSTGDLTAFAVLKWAMSLNDDGVKLNAGTKRDPNFSLVDANAGGISPERMKELGLEPRRRNRQVILPSLSIHK